jgi:hypothetical protein
MVVGDTPYDIQAAGKAGLRTIALRCGGFPEDSLRGSVAIYDDPADLCARYVIRRSQNHRQATRSLNWTVFRVRGAIDTLLHQSTRRSQATRANALLRLREIYASLTQASGPF